MLSRNIVQQVNPSVFYTEDQVKSVINSCGVVVGSDLETHFLVYCPFHYNVNTPACEIDKEKGLFFCFACQESGNLIDFVMRSTGRNYFESIRFIDQRAEGFEFDKAISKLVEEKEIEEFDVSTIERLHKGLLASAKATEYIHSRGINDDSIPQFKIGFSEKQQMTTVPVQDHTGMYVGFVGRSIEGKSFKNSHGLPRRHVLFNLNRSKYENVVVVESSFDAIRLWQLGIHAVATLGSYISKEQLHLLEKWSGSITIAPDKDEAGQKLVEKISGHTTKELVVLDLPDGVKDIGDLSDTEIKNLVEGRQQILI